MFISFGQKLRGLGHVRFGFRMKGSTALIMICVYGLLYVLWYMMLGTLWLMYGVCYLFFYLPIKGIVKLCKKEKQRKTTPSTSSFNSNPDEPPRHDHEKTINIIRWVGVAILALMVIVALSEGAILSALLFLFGGVTIAPLAVIENLRSKLKISTVVSFVLAGVLLFAGVFATPTSEPSDEDPKGDITSQTTDAPSGASTPLASTATPPKTSSLISSPAQDPEQDPVAEIVYYTATGSKYHSRKTCSGLSNAKNIYETTLEAAESRGLGPCSKCH